ncbi:MAG TPA: aldehyde dehydrogenase family protein [Patescibacteria group bacterium]|nr:aldehyde dehydrogenase family protein [Patescibacteria group bacterium]
MLIERVLAGGGTSDPATFSSWIGGAFDERPDAERIDVLDPATSRRIAVVTEAGTAGVGRAVAAAEEAAPAWRATPARERAALVQELAHRVAASADRLALLDSLDTGNPLTAMRADIDKGVRSLSDAAGLALQVKGEVFPLPGLHYTQREPWGVVGRMITFNHPAMFACARLGSALVAGNAVILKPSELAPLATLAIAELSAGILPDGVVSAVVGGPATGAALVGHPSVLRISFTGSTATALRIQVAAAASGRVKTLSFELGGKNPIVVFPDVDVDEAAAAIVRGMNYTRVQGQSCGSTSRLVIHESIADSVMERVAALVAKIRIGRPTDPATEMGSLISRAARDRCVAAIERAVADGARVVAGGRIPADPELADGAFLEPTVLDGVAPSSGIACEEVFGPVLAALTFRTEDEAVELANLGEYGLTAAVWTSDLDRALRVVSRLEAGYVWVNDVETRYPAMPFGGWRNSGVGVEHGLDEILSFTRLRSVNIRIR